MTEPDAALGLPEVKARFAEAAKALDEITQQLSASRPSARPVVSLWRL